MRFLRPCRHPRKEQRPKHLDWEWVVLWLALKIVADVLLEGYREAVVHGIKFSELEGSFLFSFQMCVTHTPFQRLHAHGPFTTRARWIRATSVTLLLSYLWGVTLTCLPGGTALSLASLPSPLPFLVLLPACRRRCVCGYFSGRPRSASFSARRFPSG